MNVLTRTMPRLARPAQTTFSTYRTFTSLTPLRPTVLPTSNLAFRPQTTTFQPASGAVADLVPREAVTSCPALGAVRFGPRNTMNGATRLVQKRRHGFLARMRSRTGRKILQRRRVKGRRQLAQ